MYSTLRQLLGLPPNLCIHNMTILRTRMRPYLWITLTILQRTTKFRSNYRNEQQKLLHEFSNLPPKSKSIPSRKKKLSEIYICVRYLLHVPVRACVCVKTWRSKRRTSKLATFNTFSLFFLETQFYKSEGEK